MHLLDEKGRLFRRVSIVDLGLALLILLLVGPALYFALEIRFASPYISHVEPMETIISKEKNVPLVVLGKWFDSKSVTRLGDIPLITAAANTQRLDLMIPTQKIYPGSYPLTVTNKRGLTTKWKKTVRLLSAPPIIEEAHQLPPKNKNEIGIILFGKNFEETLDLRVGTLVLKITRSSPTRLEAWGVLPPTMQPGTYPVKVTTNYGQSDQRDNAITLFPSSVPESPSSASADATDSTRRNLTEPVPVQILCVFEEPAMRSKRKLLKRGAIATTSNNTRPVAKIIKIHNKILIPKSNKRFIIASVVLACAQELSSQQKMFRYKAEQRGVPSEGETVKVGNRLSFQFRSLDIEGTVLMGPILLDGPLKKYLKQ